MRRFLMVLFVIALASGAHAQVMTSQQDREMRAADIVILGENHDNAAHHLGQAAYISELKPKAVVFEMLSPFMATQVNAYAGDDLANLGVVIGWEAAGWPDFAIYQPIFEAMDDAQAVGAAAPSGMVRAAFERGAAAVFEGDAARFGLTVALSEDEDAARRQLQFDAHCGAMPLEMMGGMVEAQRLRDAHFAARTLLALEAYGAPVVVITGNGHARRDWGMPDALAHAAGEVKVFGIGFLEAPAEAGSPLYDHTVVTAPAPRGDPCAAFGK
jgi:uncharacterized iron-regulated protein